MWKPEVTLEFPLRGEWMALHTPAEKVPSHGTNYFAQRYAYDFVRSEPGRVKFLRPSLARQLFAAVRASDFYCWNEPVYSAGAGEVIEVGQGWPDREIVNAFWQLGRAILFPPAVRGRDFRPLAGNYVMILGEGGVAFYGHLRRGSVAVHVGQKLAAGELVGRVGNSGNSTMPHLHFHVMNGADPLTAQGVACAFRGYERLVNGDWMSENSGIPGRLERLRA
jgi:hypothetical protein